MKRRPGDNVDDVDRGEAHLLERAMADVTRLAPDARARVRGSPHLNAAHTAARSRPSSDNAEVGEDREGSDAAFAAPGVDRRELRKLKRGDYIPSGRLDLHGKTAPEAVASVKRFISSGRHPRCVCIVHGRGLHSEGNVSILRLRVRAYLRQHPATLAYADAPRADGGTGAVYVLLRKQ